MARRKEFKSIASGLINSFISRNNDVYGYWGIGKLYSHMLASKSMIVKIDFINKTIQPPNDEFQILINQYSKRLFQRVENRGINENYLVSADLIITAYPNEPTSAWGALAPNRMLCRLAIIDDLNREHSVEENTWCSPHNPNKELKSTREY